MSTLKAYQNFLERQRQMETLPATQGQDLVLELFRPYFDKHPEIREVAWAQYIPGFNDGSPCEFSLTDLHVKYTKAFYELLAQHSPTCESIVNSIFLNAEDVAEVEDATEYEFDDLSISDFTDALGEAEDFTWYEMSTSGRFSNERAELLARFPCLEMFTMDLKTHRILLQSVFGYNIYVILSRNADNQLSLVTRDYDCGH